ncbi:MAG: Sir2 family NAD-dependent protein deacetylase [Candidatus Auribacterota bacterium]
MNQKLCDAFQLITSSGHAICLTGAGISTLSGIPDFRSPNTGLWNRYDADKIFRIDCFLAEPHYFYEFAREFIFQMFYETSPNIVHRLLSLLQKHRYLRRIITQNIDMLHQRSGTTDVLELHGSPQVSYCTRCYKDYSFDDMVRRISSTAVPFCDECGAVIKPGIIFFGELLNQRVLSAACAEAEQADCCLVLGTSLVVYPAASIPRMVTRNGGSLVIVNRDATAQDADAAYTFHMELDAFAKSFFAYLKENGLIPEN